MNNEISDYKFGENFMELNMRQTDSAIKGTRTLPAVPVAKKLNVDSSPNIFSREVPPINKGQIGEIESPFMLGITQDVPGTFSTPATSGVAVGNESSNCKIEGEKFI